MRESRFFLPMHETTDLKIGVILIVEGESLDIVWLCSEESDSCIGKKK